MKNGVITIGEALIDFIPTSNNHYLKSPGGAPANVAVGVARLGAKSTFIGKVGNDHLGHFLVKTLKKNEVDTMYVSYTDKVKTGFTLVTTKADGEREFEFYIQPSADTFLTEQEINIAPFLTHKVFHFGSISLIDDPVKTATLHAIKLAKQHNLIVSFDPNIRMSLWNCEEVARETILSVLPNVDVLKLSEEEFEFITGSESIEQGLVKLKDNSISIMIITHGANGSYVITKDGQKHVPAMDVKAIDTTGAGDAFVSGILYNLNQTEIDLEELTLDQISEFAKFASVSGGLTVATKGAMTALPTRVEVEERL